LVILADYPQTASAIETGLSIYMIFIVIMALNAFLNAASHIYQDFTIAESKPIKGYIQVVKTIIILIGGIIILANVFGKSPLGLIHSFNRYSCGFIPLAKQV
jgi:miniconductance mechanosensitive channel